MSQLALIEAEERNKQLKKQIADCRSRTTALDSQGREIDHGNYFLRLRVEEYQREIEKFKVLVRETSERLKLATESKTGPGVRFGKPSTDDKAAYLAAEVSQLSFDNSDSDDESI